MFAWDRIVDALRIVYREAMQTAELPVAASVSDTKEHAFA
jgi:hypothetical protein